MGKELIMEVSAVQEMLVSQKARGFQRDAVSMSSVLSYLKLQVQITSLQVATAARGFGGVLFIKVGFAKPGGVNNSVV